MCDCCPNRRQNIDYGTLAYMAVTQTAPRIVVVSTDSSLAEQYADTETVRVSADPQIVVAETETVIVDAATLESPLETVNAIRARNQTAGLTYVDDGDATATGATDAITAGATAYQTRAHEQDLRDRIESARLTNTAIDRRPTQVYSPLDRTQTLKRLHEIMAATDISFEERLRKLLAAGRSTLGVDYGVLSDIDGREYEVHTVSGVDELVTEGTTLALSETYCERVIETGDSLGFGAVSEEVPALTDRDALQTLEIGCYLGAPVDVDGQYWGTLCFFSQGERAKTFSSWEHTVVELLANWVGRELTTQQHRDELRAERDRAERILERIDDAFFALDEEWTITYLNERAHELINPESQTLVGTNLWEQFPEAVDSPFETHYRRALEQQETVRFEAYFGPLETYFEVRAYPSKSGVSVYFTDVTARKHREQELRRYERIIETIDDGVLVIDDDQQIAYVNDAYATLFEQSVSALRGEPASTLVDEETWIEWMSVVLSMADTDVEHATMEATLETPRGTVPIEAHITRLASSGSHGDEFVCIVRDVTDRKERERTIRQLLEATQQLFACETRTEVATVVAEAASNVFGYDVVGVRLYDPEREELVLEGATETVWDRFGDRSRVHIEDSPMGEVFKRGESVVLDDLESVSPYDYGDLQTAMCVPIADAGVITVGSPETDAFGVSDVMLAELLAASAATALERTERRETLLRYEQVLETVEGMVYALDADGRFTLLTEPFAEYLGYDRETLVGKHVSTVLEADELARGTESVHTLLSSPSTESVTFETRCVRADGKTFPVETELSLLTVEGAFRGTVGAVRDITQRKERERYLQVLSRVLRHNLRNDLTVVIGYADHLTAELEDEALVSMVRELREIAADLANLSENAKRIEYTLARGSVEGKPVSLAETVTAVCDRYQESLADVRLTVDVDDDLAVYADDELSTVLAELLENAIEHARGDQPQIRIEATETAETVTLALDDDGPGIDQTERKIITGERDITQLTHGSGLGLWLVRWIVDSYDGDIAFAESHLGGTRVEITLERATIDTVTAHR